MLSAHNDIVKPTIMKNNIPAQGVKMRVAGSAFVCAVADGYWKRGVQGLAVRWESAVESVLGVVSDKQSVQCEAANTADTAIFHCF